MSTDSETEPQAVRSVGDAARRSLSWLRTLLWVAAVVAMLAAATYQRLTGPTHPLRGTIEVAGEEHRYRLVRSQETSSAAEVIAPQVGSSGTLHWRRYPTSEPYAQTAMQHLSLDVDVWAGSLPVQPAAGKVEYHVTQEVADGELRIPADETVILRYKDPVPVAVLLPHVLLMFFAVLVGMRAGLGALLAPESLRGLAWFTLAALTVGGMVLGPIVQKYAFGAYWTGWPWGKDLTDNKALIMWLVWIVACAVLGLRAGRRERSGRIMVVVAAVVMTVVYLIPHSMRGSELDYGAVDSGVDPGEAIGTSDE